MGRLFTYLWQHGFDAMSVAGSAMSMSRIAFDNVQSLAAHRRLGGQTIGEALFVCLGRWQFMKSSISPRWHLSWRENQRPTLEIRSPTSI
jgi:hypothetical protein